MNNKSKRSIPEQYLQYYESYIEKYGKERMLVLMQVGSFYEAYATETRGPNLKLLEEITEATVAHLGKGKKTNVIDESNPLLWGFPMLASTKFFGILIENGYRLIIINQVTLPPNPKREVVAIYTPGTYLESTHKPASNFVCLIYLEEINQRIGCPLLFAGMSAIDVSTGDLIVHESNSLQNDEKLGLDEVGRFLNSLAPKEIIIVKENLVKINEDIIVEYLDLEGKYYQFKTYIPEFNKVGFQKNILEKV